MLLSLVHGDRLVGGVIFAGADESTLSKLAAEDVALLAGVYARVLAGALDAEDQRTLAETFATANQQAGTTERATSQAARLRMLATMAAGAAHELNTPLAVIAGRAQMLQRDATDARTQQDLAVIAEHAHRASAIVSELLACAKPEPPRAETVMLSAWAHGVRQYWHDAAGPKPAQIDVRISDDALVVQADPQQLDEAVHAIIANAIEAAPAGGARVVINSPSRPTDDTIVVSIGDNGCGMTPDVLAHACDPFFSHRTAGRGRGLGLSRATRLIEINGGRMWIDSTPGQGTTVHVALPAAQ
jgi:signal transduction histidine kinase